MKYMSLVNKEGDKVIRFSRGKKIRGIIEGESGYCGYSVLYRILSSEYFF
jgi:hypothetical protein